MRNFPTQAEASVERGLELSLQPESTQLTNIHLVQKPGWQNTYSSR